MKTITLILRLRFNKEEAHGVLEEPVSGWQGVFSNLDDLTLRLREIQEADRLREKRQSAAPPAQDGPITPS
jgi:hypothetical protein